MEAACSGIIRLPSSEVNPVRTGIKEGFALIGKMMKLCGIEY